MALAILTPPAAKAITLDEVKRHLRIETGDDDTYLDDLIDVSTAHLETVTGIKLINQAWRQYFDCAPVSGAFRLEIAPVREITDMRVYEAGGSSRTIPPTALELDSVSVPPRLGVSENLQTGIAFNGIEIDMVVGYGETGVDVPDTLKRALLLLIAHAYEFRGAVPIGQQPASEPHGFRTLIAPFRRAKI